MMLSTVSWKDFGVDGPGCVWAMFNCGRINDKTQSTMPARRRCLVFILSEGKAVSLSASRLLFAPLREISSRKNVSRKGARNSRKARREAGRAEVASGMLYSYATSRRSSSRPRAFRSWRCRLCQPCLSQSRRRRRPALPASCLLPTGGLLSPKDYGTFP